MPDSIIKECQKFFCTKNLYEVLGANKEQNENDLRKSYYKTSLIYHPDRQKDKDKVDFTQRFQLVTRVYSILSDEEKRKIYDETGFIDEGDDLTGKSYEDWVKYWQLLFPKITMADIEDFHKKYKGSDEELNDLIIIYNRSEGDMDIIMETLMFASYGDEDRIRELLDKLIAENRIKAYKKYTHESKKKICARAKRAKIEEKRFEKEAKKKKKDSSTDDLAAAIQARHQNYLEASENFLDRLSQKYCKQKSK